MRPFLICHLMWAEQARASCRSQHWDRDAPRRQPGHRVAGRERKRRSDTGTRHREIALDLIAEGGRLATPAGTFDADMGVDK